MEKTYDGLDFELFRTLANDQNLTSAEKIGFTPESRDGYEELILSDITKK